MTERKLSHSADDCVAAFKTLAATGAVTRDRYRKESGIPAPVWEYHFGTFAELKRAAGVAPLATVTKLHTAVAKATAAKRFDPINKERADYADKYIRDDQGRYKTVVIASDLHDKEIDPFYLRVFLDTCARVQPEVVSLGGDVFDLPEFGKYTVDPREWDAVGRIKFVHENILAPLRTNCPDAQIDLIEGNHECVSPDTEILTDEGWITADRISIHDKVASFNMTTHRVQYAAPIAVAVQHGRDDIYELTTTFKKECITANHNLVYNGNLCRLHDMEEFDGDKFLNALSIDPEDPLELDENLVRMALWMMMYGSIRTTEGDDRYWLSFKVPGRIARRIKYTVLGIKGLKFTNTRKGIEIEGPRMTELVELVTGSSDIEDCTRWTDTPDWFERLPASYGKIVARELTWASKHGFMCPNTAYYSGHGHQQATDLQRFFMTRGVPCAVKYLPKGQYMMVFNEKNQMEARRGKRVKLEHQPVGSVVSIQTVDRTLITRLDGKVNFTGNCRLVKHLADFSPATRAILGDLHGMTIGDLFGLGKYQVNYVAKADLKSYTERDARKELENNYRVYWDSLMVHHFPHARNLGLPGVNGHHHSHVVWPMYNIHRGSYEWHQLGSGHRRKASYCEGEKWHNGFAIAHIDTLTKSVNIEYVPITSFAVVGGKFYTREAHEIIT